MILWRGWTKSRTIACKFCDAKWPLPEDKEEAEAVWDQQYSHVAAEHPVEFAEIQEWLGPEEEEI